MKRSQKIERALLETLSLVPDRYWSEAALFNDTRRKLVDEPTRTEMEEGVKRLDAQKQVKLDRRQDYTDVKITRDGLDRIAD